MPAGRADLAAMLTEMLAVEYCDHVRGRFLPIAQTHNGQVPRGDEPVGGRWWVRDCRTRVHNGQLAVFLDGVGWAWAEGEKDYLFAAWSTDEYVYFNAGGTVVGPVDLDLDPVRKLAWIRFEPTMMPYAKTAPTTRVEARGNFGAAVLSFFTFGLMGSMADDMANEAVRQRVAAVFRHKLGAGFDLVFDLRQRQLDFVTRDTVVPPLRPFKDGIRWLVNERQVFHPRGVHVIGPFAPTQAAGVDFRVIRGAVRYRVECERDVVAWFSPITNGGRPYLPAPRHAQTDVLYVGATSRTLSAMCPWYLITETLERIAAVDVRVRADRSGYPLPGL